MKKDIKYADWTGLLCRNWNTHWTIDGIKIIVGYGLSENDIRKDKALFWYRLQDESVTINQSHCDGWLMVHRGHGMKLDNPCLNMVRH